MKTQFTLPDPTSIRYVREIHATPQRVWDAYTMPDLVRKWMTGPHPDTNFTVCDMDMRTGGTYRWVWQHPQGRLEIEGEVLAAEKPHRLVTEERMSDVDMPSTRHEVTLQAEGERTIVTGTLSYATQEARDAAYASGMTQGMDASLDLLEGVA